MKIEHIAIWVQDLEKMKGFYEKYFEGRAGNKYHNSKKNFTSYFLSFHPGCRLELMHDPEIPDNNHSQQDQYRGLIHFAISVGSRQKVDDLTAWLHSDGYKVHSQPRTTGDGYYESVVADPEGNRIEIAV